MKECCAILLAAGKSARMKTDRPTALCEVLFQPILTWAVNACRAAGLRRICAVAGCGAELVRAALDASVETVVPPEPAGTGRAVLCARAFLEANGGGDVLVLGGDTPLLDSATIQTAHRLHQSQGNAATLITARPASPAGYAPGDASPDELAVREVHSGAYWFRVQDLLDALPFPGGENAQSDYRLADAIPLLQKKGRRIGAYCSENPDIALGAATRSELLRLNQLANRRVAEALMEEGVEFLSLDGVLLAPDCRVGRGTRILPGTILRPGAVIGENCVIGPNSLVSRSVLGDRTLFNSSQCYQSEIGSDVSIGPFCHLRPNSRILDGVHIGDFVEVKNSVVGAGTHISHLTYVGDSDVGQNVNFGCGVATANFNGVSKARCTIGDHAFLGCNTNLVAPVTIGQNGYTAAGSTITDDVPAEALGIARARQVNKEGYNRKIRR